MGMCDPFVYPADPAEDWDEDDGYEYNDTKAPADLDDEFNGLNRPDYVGIVCGAQFKLENAEGVTEYALVTVSGDRVAMFEMSESDLCYLARQIKGLIDE